MNTTRPLAMLLAAPLLLLAACGTSPARADLDVDDGPEHDVGDTVEVHDANDDPSTPDIRDDVEPADAADVGEDTEAGPSCIDWDSPLNQRQASSPEACADIAFVCSGGEAYSDACGCGCRYEPPTCPDPTDPAVGYVGGSPEECSVIDFDCGGDFFDGPCGCGCIACPSPDAPNVSYVSRDPRECADIDFDCAVEGFSGFNSDACGCGCEYAGCDTTKIWGTSGMAEPFQAGARCEFLILCSTESLAASGLSELMAGYYADARCGDGSAIGCPAGTASFCEPYIEQVDTVDIAAACSASRLDDVHRILCGGDL